MRKLLAEPIFIFLSVLGSLWVDGYTDELKEKKELNESIITLSNEISKNIDYTKEHIYQVKNLKYMTDVILEDYSNVTIEKLKSTHDNNPFFHDIDINGKTTYVKQYDNNQSIVWMMRGFLAWEPADIFFKSMLNSGKLLEIENVTPEVAEDLNNTKAFNGIFMFQVLSVIFFFSFITSMAFYLGWMQWLVSKVGWFFQITIGTTPCESMNAAANIILGMT